MCIAFMLSKWGLIASSTSDTSASRLLSCTIIVLAFPQNLASQSLRRSGLPSNHRTSHSGMSCGIPASKISVGSHVLSGTCGILCCVVACHFGLVSKDVRLRQQRASNKVLPPIPNSTTALSLHLRHRFITSLRLRSPWIVAVVGSILIIQVSFLFLS